MGFFGEMHLGIILPNQNFLFFSVKFSLFINMVGFYSLSIKY